ncbi:hypothetical protein [Emcibacter sp. SYSU 3D8]|uniref:hypothetical protein n=1 Tax=Emcibacter sp. SYSU 3D8 TaxID=3133969 RepID=UPI0031FE97F2
MTKARLAGGIWTGVFVRHCGRAKALLVALPLLMLSVAVDHGFAGATASTDSGKSNSHAADVAGTQGTAQPPGRAAAVIADPARPTPKLSGGGLPGAHGIVRTVSFDPLRGPVIPILGNKQQMAPLRAPVAARPRAPPSLAA